MANKITLNFTDLFISDRDLQDLCLMEIEKVLLMNGRSLKDFAGMPLVTEATLAEYGNVLMYNELNFDVDEMGNLHQQHVEKLNCGQQKIYDEIISAVNGDNGGLMTRGYSLFFESF